MFVGLDWWQPLAFVILQAQWDKLNCRLWHFVSFWRLLRELRLKCLQNGAILINLVLGNAVAEGLSAIEHFKEYNSKWPNIDLRRNLWVILIESFRRQVPISAHSLWGQFNPGLLAFQHDFAESKVQHFNHSVAEHNITWLKIIVNYLLLEPGEVGNCWEQLLYDALGLFLFEALMLTQVNG